ncbi:MAG: phosphomethylpyrimidine synthase ThiC, partial [Deltaproteobacteria bacterium]|nr:phosphomethylpyrimidine synthase ThiC [Deltaproteobacteria bacterium]
MTQIEAAKKGVITKEMLEAAKNEGVDAADLMRLTAQGKVVIPNNTNRKARLVGIGMGLRTKVNASIGTSSDIIDVRAEVEKAMAAEKAGADTLMELSCGG